MPRPEIPDDVELHLCLGLEPERARGEDSVGKQVATCLGHTAWVVELRD